MERECKQAETASQQQVRDELVMQMQNWGKNAYAHFDFDVDNLSVGIPHLCNIKIERIAVKGWKRFFKPYKYSITYETISYEIDQKTYTLLYNGLGKNKHNK